MSLSCVSGPAVMSPDLNYIASLEGENFLKVRNDFREWLRGRNSTTPGTCSKVAWHMAMGLQVIVSAIGGTH